MDEPFSKEKGATMPPNVRGVECPLLPFFHSSSKKNRFLHVTRPPSTPAQNAKFDERKEALLVLDSLPNLRERGSFFRGAKLFWITKSQSRET